MKKKKKKPTGTALYGWESEDTIQSSGARKQLPECPPFFTERDNGIWGLRGGGAGKKPYIVKVFRKPKYSFPESNTLCFTKSHALIPRSRHFSDVSRQGF